MVIHLLSTTLHYALFNFYISMHVTVFECYSFARPFFGQQNR